MKIKGVIEDLHFLKKLKMMVKIVTIYLGLSLVLWAAWVSSFLATSLVWPIFLKIYRPLSM